RTSTSLPVICVVKGADREVARVIPGCGELADTPGVRASVRTCCRQGVGCLHVHTSTRPHASLGDAAYRLHRHRQGGEIQLRQRTHLAHRLAYGVDGRDRKSTRLNSSHVKISYAVFCLKKKKNRKRDD